jgi:hypothetical protein
MIGGAPPCAKPLDGTTAITSNVIASASEAIQRLDCRVGLGPPRNDEQEFFLNFMLICRIMAPIMV